MSRSLTLDHPPVNAFSTATLQELEAAFDELLADDQVKVIVITGGGQLAFVAGADIKEMASLARTERRRGGALVFMTERPGLLNKIECSPKPVIAAINGVALGGGMELAMACHMRILADRARIGQSESNLGIIPGWGGTQRLPRHRRPGKAIELILTGDMINAQEAFRLGLANKVVPAGQVHARGHGSGEENCRQEQDDQPGHAGHGDQRNAHAHGGRLALRTQAHRGGDEQQ